MGKIKLGDKAPLFKLESYNVGTIDLAEFIGKQKIVIIFSRYFGCPICQMEIKEIVKRAPEIEKKGAKLLYITQSGEKIAKEFIEKENITFPVIPSSKDELYKEYGLGKMTLSVLTTAPLKVMKSKKLGISHGEYEGYEMQCPGQFVINEDGLLIFAKKSWLRINPILEVLS